MENNEKDELKELLKTEKVEKKALKKEKKKAKKEIKQEIREERENNLTDKEKLARKRNEPPVRPVLEEIGNSVTHGVGAALAIVALILMLNKSHNGLMYTASIIYGVCMFLTMSMSCLYHAWRGGSKVKRLWRRFDYSSIYLLIGGTFTPLLLIEFYENCNIPHAVGITWFIIMWVLIITGITFTCIFGPGRVRFINFPLYFILGWSGVAFVPIWIYNERFALMLWIFFGGVVYTLGMIPFAKKSIVSAHFIWHIFVLGGALVQFLGIYLYVYM